MMRFKILSSVLLFAALFHNPMAFSAQFNFKPRATAKAEYTDNVNLTKDDKEDDFIIVVGAGFTASLEGKTSGAELSFDQRYAFYDENTDNDAWRIPLRFRAWTAPSKRTNLQFTNNFLLTEDPVQQDILTAQDGRVEETGDTTVRRGRNQYYRNTAGFRASHQFGSEDRIYAGFLYGLLRNDDDQVQDNDQYRVSTGIDYWFTNRFGSQFFGEYTRGEFSQSSDFDGTPASDFDNWLGSLRLLGRTTKHFALYFQYNQVNRHYISGDDNDYLVYAGSAGFTYDITEDTFLSLGLGYWFQKIENEKDNSNPFLDAQLSKTWDFRRGSIKLLGSAGLTQNNFGAQPNLDFQQFAAIQGSASYSFTRKLSGDTGAFYRYAFSPEREDRGGNDDLITNRFQFRLGLSYPPTRWMTLRLGYEFNKYISDDDDDYYENRALLTITLAPDQPWRF
jgi:hypothetical protein